MKIRSMLLRCVLGTTAALAVAYLSDFVVFRLRVAKGTAFGSVTVRQFYAIGEKNGRTEYVFGSEQPQPCVNALVGHQGLEPCWYVRRHPEQQIRI